MLRTWQNIKKYSMLKIKRCHDKLNLDLDLFLKNLMLNFLDKLPGLLIGPSGVRALPLAAGINVGGHYKWHFFLFLSFFLLLSGLIANSPRRDCRRVLKFCMGS